VVCGLRGRSSRLQLFHLRAVSGDGLRYRRLLSKSTRAEEWWRNAVGVINTPSLVTLARLEALSRCTQ
jgi:hypothetical protein